MNYESHYNRLMHKAKNRTHHGYTESHHIIPKCIGGTDSADNLVELTAREHYVAHQLLVKLYPGHRGLTYAALLMTRLGRGNGRINNRMYAWIREKYAQSQSRWMKEWLKVVGNPSSREEVKRKRRKAWSGTKNPCYKNPNWTAIRAAALKTKGTKHSVEHSTKISQSLTKWHSENKERHPMKNPKTLAKAIRGRQETARRKKIVYWGA